MKRLFTLAVSVVMTIAANAQEQLNNCDFEKWETINYTFKPTFGKERTVTCDEPVSWSSFLDGTGSLKSTAAVVPQIFKDTDVRNGSSGQYCARIKANSVVGVVAQGNLTTGCVNMGSMVPTDATGNYNYINHDRADQSMKFTGRPVYVKIWLKGKCQNKANVAVHLTGNGYYQDPVNQNKPNAELIAIAQKANGIDVTENWMQYEIPFEYKSTNSPSYVLVNISTSAEPGKGAADDVLYIDDIEMVYDHTAISNINIDDNKFSGVAFNISGQKVDGNAKGIVIKNGKKYYNPER